ncbi:MFS transporter [Parendozoicomonas haliclonae]|uniref:Alpha-ketoglutarate permease n=1 Tax=Parendozoicomonas haliclonae TaxID=1960125 RepID=A0A1X7AQ96_9GAMM|nr:MFS transporter [Parendozoicomonas haliclonae]SMA49583.1 Alpha-ketoglutarate permease [Parendozoicomonas haliclonae]
MHKKAQKIWFGLLSGNVIEYYDYVLYGVMAPVLSRLFFPSDSRLTSLAATFAIFASGTLVRPLGGLILGYCGDYFSRRTVLMICSFLTGITTFAIGCLPASDSFSQAALLLLVLRCLQGLGMSSEFCSVLVIAGELAPPDKRGFLTSLAHSSGMAGTLLASLMTAMIFLLPDSALYSWGWRIPFWLGGIICLNAYILRSRLPTLSNARSIPRERKLTSYGSTFLQMFFMVAINTLVYHLYFIFQATRMIEHLDLPARQVMFVNTLTLLVLVICCALGGWFSDRSGHRKVYLISLIFTAVTAIPLSMLTSASNLWICAFGMFLCAIVAGFMLGSSSVLYTELWPASLRMTGTTVPYNLAIVCFGASTPLVALYLIEATGLAWSTGLYVTGLAAAALLLLWRISDRTGTQLDGAVIME